MTHLYKINASKKIYVSLPSYTILPVHKDTWIEIEREGAITIAFI